MIFLLSTTNWIFLGFWVALLIITVIIELDTANLTTIWFSLAAIVALVLAALDINYWIQILVFVVVGLILVYITRPLIKRTAGKEIVRTNADRVIGKVGIVTAVITPNEIGEVKVINEMWRAFNKEGLEFAIGEKVSIDGIEGIKLIVSKLDKDKKIEII
ncbi:MAG TPA: NfeD family protein [Acholeplasmataceae bacterium]|nr:NfeD family protein [Acholeplasmataceae bacterium]